jgi:stage V sporulation protein D (sporulation-specific penicillin-binding protein)
MSKRRPRKQKSFMQWASIFSGAGYCLLIGRCAFFQLAHGKEIRKEADKAHTTTISVVGKRGPITDRFGKVLASSTYIGELGFDPWLFNHPESPKAGLKNDQFLKNSILSIAPIIGVTPDNLTKTIRDILADSRLREAKAIAKLQAENKPKAKVVIKRFYSLMKNVPLHVAEDIKARMSPDFVENKVSHEYRIIGFAIKDESQRELTSPLPFSPVVGFVNNEGKGQTGLERGCNVLLTGTDSKAVAEVDKQRKPFPETISWTALGHDGYTVKTALDPYIQQLAYNQAQLIMDQYHPRGVSIIVQDPETGDMLAMVSAPTLDPSPEARKALKLVPKSADNVTGDERMVERCASFLYEPGSTVKTITVAAALEDGCITMNSSFVCDGKYKVGSKTIHCPSYGPWDAHGHGVVDARGLLEHSCNVAAAKIGVRMGAERLYADFKKFGVIHTSLFLDLPGTRIGSEVHNAHEAKSDGAIARVAFGHSLVTTSSHIVRCYAAIANRGVMMKQRLVTMVTDANGKVIKENRPEAMARVISEHNADNMVSMLRDTVTHGTGKPATVKGYWVAGKTGTAKKYKPGLYDASFIGFLPAGPQSKPRAVIQVVVDEPQKGPHYGAQVAAPAFQAIADSLMSYWKVPQDDPQNEQFETAHKAMKHDHDAPSTPGKLAL